MTYPIAKNYNLTNLAKFKLASLFLLLLTLTACGGGGGGSDGGSTLSGTAATGAAIFGKVSIFGANGGIVADVQTDSSGKYSADVSGLTPPFCVCVIPDDSSKSTQYSYATGAGTANITPLTTLTLYYANGEQNPEQLADASTWPAASQNVAAAVPDILATVNANFASLFSAQGFDASSYDFFTSQFIPGDQFDQILDQLNIDITGAAPIITVDGSPFNFDLDIRVPTGGDLGVVTYEGGGSNLLSAQGRTFKPGVVIPFGVTFVLQEVDENEELTGNAITLMLGDNNSVVSILVAATVINGSSVPVANAIQIWSKSAIADPAITELSNVSFDGTTVTFNGIALSGNFGFGSDFPLILNGSLIIQ